MNKIHQKRLLNVAKALRDAAKVPLLKKVFTMQIFGWDRQAKVGDKIVDLDQKPDNTCGTPACALGHYAARTDLQRAFKLKHGDVQTTSGSPDVSGVCYEHFGLLELWGHGDEWIELFADNGCGGATTPLQAAKYIEKFVARKAKGG
jgi:hypothetical protein